MAVAHHQGPRANEIPDGTVLRTTLSQKTFQRGNALLLSEQRRVPRASVAKDAAVLDHRCDKRNLAAASHHLCRRSRHAGWCSISPSGTVAWHFPSAKEWRVAHCKIKRRLRCCCCSCGGCCSGGCCSCSCFCCRCCGWSWHCPGRRMGTLGIGINHPAQHTRPVVVFDHLYPICVVVSADVCTCSIVAFLVHFGCNKAPIRVQRCCQERVYARSTRANVQASSTSSSGTGLYGRSSWSSCDGCHGSSSTATNAVQRNGKQIFNPMNVV